MKVLIACEYSGVVREAFRAKGHEAISCDLLPTEIEGPHIQGDVLEVLDREWDLVIAHPPCTYLANSGVCWLHKDPTRWQKLDQGAEFFRKILECRAPKLCIENPIMHKYARERIGGEKYAQIVQPWMFGHPESKATCLWLRGLPKLEATNNVKEEWKKLPKAEAQRLHYLPPSSERAKLRSKTYQGIAEAMADKWG